MGTLAALTAGLVIWLIAWALGVKAFDAFLIPVAFLLVAATGRLASPFVRRQLGR